MTCNLKIIFPKVTCEGLSCVHFSGEGDHNRCWDYIRETDEFARKLIEEDMLAN